MATNMNVRESHEFSLLLKLLACDGKRRIHFLQGCPIYIHILSNKQSQWILKNNKKTTSWEKIDVGRTEELLEEMEQSCP